MAAYGADRSSYATLQARQAMSAASSSLHTGHVSASAGEPFSPKRPKGSGTRAPSASVNAPLFTAVGRLWLPCLHMPFEKGAAVQPLYRLYDRPMRLWRM